MNDADESAEAPRKPNIVWKLGHWVLVIFFGLITLGLTANTERLNLPGAPVILFWVALGLIGVATLACVPPIFFRLPGKGKVAAYGGLFVGLVLSVSAVAGIQSAYERTPEGKLEVAQREKEEAAAEKAAQERRAVEQQFAEAEEAKQQLREIDRQQQACLSWGGEVRALSEVVRDNLHDPSSFEHVETRFIAPGEDRLNVVMAFRAANGFGAVRTAAVRARMIPATCEIVEVGEIEPL